MSSTLLSPEARQAGAYDTWQAYMNANMLVCPGPFDMLEPPRPLVLAGKRYRHSGFELAVENKDRDTTVKLGVLGAPKDLTFGTRNNLEAAFAWFNDNDVEWVVVDGDLATTELSLEEVVEVLGQAALPTLMLPGNWESRASFARAYAARADKYPTLVNGAWVRRIVADDVELWTVPGYYDSRFAHTGTACIYTEDDIKKMIKELSPAGDAPVVLVSHGPPLGRGRRALDYIHDKRNVGDPLLAKLIAAHDIPFGIFDHVLEAGGTAVGKDFAKPVKPKTWATRLYLGAGTISADPWKMNDGQTRTGIAAILTIKGKKAQFEVKTFAPRPEAP
ncbi:MAG: metallophosphoesterase [Deltaproteobacteria bacterium]|nr:metallophosphoesterase [Deltaproteobacteria bacterium]